MGLLTLQLRRPQKSSNLCSAVCIYQNQYMLR
ncbi:Uncharacterised protein [Klebsiella quasipneumoniae]|nr:Uncharacterised protein [Klebsiella pneumoniae]VEB78498.1 Uncharacterised protein [Klebsiella quasipneumoniae]